MECDLNPWVRRMQWGSLQVQKSVRKEMEALLSRRAPNCDPNFAPATTWTNLPAELLEVV